MESNLNCDEILKLIRAMKTYNLALVKYGSIELHRGTVEQTAELHVAHEKTEEQNAALDELQSFQEENLLINDPEAYEKQFANG